MAHFIKEAAMGLNGITWPLKKLKPPIELNISNWE
jgi:hypothetical protein